MTKGGKRLGKGKNASVYTIDGDNESIINMISSSKLTNIILEYRYKTVEEDIDQYENIKNLLLSIKNTHVCKYFDKSINMFDEEINGYRNALKSNNVNENIVGNFGTKYNNDLLLGFIFIYKNKLKMCTIMNKCELTLNKYILNKEFINESEFIKLIKEILLQLINIQKINIAHGDIKLDNIMKCNNEYKLIDWGYMRVLDYDILQTSKKPMLGSSSIYFKVYADGHNGKVNGINWKHAYKISTQFKFNEISIYNYFTNKTAKYINHTNDYYNSLYNKYDSKEIFNEYKYGLDLHAFGWILYDILIHSGKNYKDKYMNFVLNLFLMNAKEAYNIINK